MTGMVLFCNLKDSEVSSATGEEFIPLNIQKAEIAQEPTYTILYPEKLIKKRNKMQQQKNEIPLIDPNEFPTLMKYDSKLIENKIQSLMKTQQMTRQQALVALEQDLWEIESRSDDM